MQFAVYIQSVRSARGAEGVAVSTAKGLAARGHAVDLLVEDDQGWLLDDMRDQKSGVGIVIMRAPQPNSLRGRMLHLWILVRSVLAHPLQSLLGDNAYVVPLARELMKDKTLPILGLLNYIKRTKPDAILSFLNGPNLVLLLTAQVARGGTRYVVNVRNHMSVAAAQSESTWVRSVPSLMRRFFPQADRIVAPSEGVARDVASITGLPQTRITTIPNPVFRPEIVALSNEPVNHPWLQDRDVPVIIAAGKLQKQKDFSTLIRAFAIVRKVQPSRLLILGTGPERDQLAQLVKDLGLTADVEMCGQVDNPFPYFKRSSVFVLSSRWEGLPNALIEAMACGCPVVSTDCPSGPREILEDGVYGKLVPVGAEDELARAILSTLASPLQSETLISRARYFSYDDAIAQYEAVLTRA